MLNSHMAHEVIYVQHEHLNRLQQRKNRSSSKTETLKFINGLEK